MRGKITKEELGLKAGANREGTQNGILKLLSKLEYLPKLPPPHHCLNLW